MQIEVQFVDHPGQEFIEGCTIPDMDMYAAFSMKVIEPFPFEWIQWKFVSVVIIQRQTVFKKITR